MNLKTSNIANNISQSEIRSMSIECDKVGGLNLAQGVCDLPLPKEVEEGAIAAIKNGINTYTRYDGVDELREAIVVKTKKYNNIDITADKNIVVSEGTTGALYASLVALIEPGDEVILFEPYYGYHVNTLVAVGAVPKFVKLVPPNWDFDMNELEKLVTSKTKAILVNTPSNPVGKVFSMSELKSIADFAIKHDLFIFSDEIYEYFVYDGLKHISPASLPEIFDRTITVSGYSKTFSTTGWRVGYCICHEKWKESIGFVNDVIYVCAPAPLQMGIASGIANIPDTFYNELRLKYQNKRDKICKALFEIGLTPYVPKGAYYVMADVSSVLGKNSKEKAMYILQKTGVAVVPGSAFYHDDGGEDLVRFCFAKDDAILDLAIEKLKKL
jgi:aminotransferase